MSIHITHPPQMRWVNWHGMTHRRRKHYSFSSQHHGLYSTQLEWSGPSTFTSQLREYHQAFISRTHHQSLPPLPISTTQQALFTHMTTHTTIYAFNLRRREKAGLCDTLYHISRQSNWKSWIKKKQWKAKATFFTGLHGKQAKGCKRLLSVCAGIPNQKNHVIWPGLDTAPSLGKICHTIGHLTHGGTEKRQCIKFLKNNSNVLETCSKSCLTAFPLTSFRGMGKSSTFAFTSEHTDIRITGWLRLIILQETE